jgi:DNA-binding transcriptional LysR family regulator
MEQRRRQPELHDAKDVDRFFNSGLKLQHLRILAAFAELRQVRAVAQAFHVTQPAISKQIAEMENALGVDLIQRVGQRAEFTPFGHALARRAREVLHQLHHARKDFDSLLAGATGKLALGVASTVTPVLIPDAIAAFHTRAPNVAVSIEEGTADKLLPLLESGRIDLLIGRTPAPMRHSAFRDASIADDPLVLAVSRRHPLAFRMTPTWRDLEGSQWILPAPDSPVYRELEVLLRKHGMAFPNGCIQSVSLTANIGLIARTALIGLLPRSMALQQAAEGNLAIVPLDISSVLARVYMIWHAERQSPAMELMRESLSYAGRIQGGSRTP